MRAARGEFMHSLTQTTLGNPVKRNAARKHGEAATYWNGVERCGSLGRRGRQSRYLRKMYAGYRRFPSTNISTSLGPKLMLGALYAGDIFSPIVTRNLVHTSTALVPE